MKASVSGVILLSSMLLSCASPRTVEPVVPTAALVEPEGVTVDARQLVARMPLTVIVFFSRECHCLNQHDARLRALYDEYHARGVQIVMVDPEVHSSVDADEAEARRRGYPFPILIDPHGRLADALGAEYATYSVVVDAQGRVRYHGGIDSDKTHLRDSATPYLKNALDDLLAGKDPRQPEAKTLGCALETW